MVDNIRKPDEGNPNGYYEFEKAKKIKRDSSWLNNTHVKVFKMVSLLLYDLPPEYKYKIIFMRRKMEEILVSQKIMLHKSEVKESNINDGEMGKIFRRHLKGIEGWAEKQENIEILYVNYNDVIENSLENAEIVNRFLHSSLDVKKMVEVVDNSLYRNRVKFG